MLDASARPWTPSELPLLPQAFYERDALAVARDLLGAFVVHDGVVLRVTEVEAYRYPDDSANHCRAGRTARNAPMWGPPGHAYVYVCYGLHAMLNLVTGPEGEGAAVLIRSAEPVAGAATVRARRAIESDDPAALLAGPGKVGQALGLSTAFSGHPLFVAGRLEVRAGEPPREVLVGPRVGVDYARPQDREAPYRFADAASRVVSQPRTLQPLRRFSRPAGGQR
jgi:DNA-3-methyladenine glycosylase